MEEKLIDLAYEKLQNAEDNGYPQWDSPLDEIVRDLMYYDADFESLDEHWVEIVVTEALERHKKLSK